MREPSVSGRPSSTLPTPSGGEAFPAEPIDLGEVKRGKGFDAERGGQEVVGEFGVAGQCRTVHVRADDTALDDALGAVAHTVADAVPYPAQWGRVGPESCSAAVVLETGERLGQAR